MAYVDQTYLEDNYTVERVAQVFCVQTADGSTTGIADANSLAKTATAASSEVDESLIGVTDLPFVVVPEPVKEIAGIFTMYRGSLKRPEYMIDPKRSPFRTPYEDAVARLKQIRLGFLRVSKDLPPRNVGGMTVSHLPSTIVPNVFLPVPGDDTSGFNGGGM